MSGLNYVGEAMEDKLFYRYVESLIFSEIIPTLDLSKSELESFARDVIKRFQNPYIQHELIAISLNSMSKFKTRVIPQLKKYHEVHGRIPTLMSHAIAAQLLMYRGTRGEEVIPIQDSEGILSFVTNLWGLQKQGELTILQLVERFLRQEHHWDENLDELDGLAVSIANHLSAYLEEGVRAVLSRSLQS
jgi:tagaturonate reductase